MTHWHQLGLACYDSSCRGPLLIFLLLLLAFILQSHWNPYTDSFPDSSAATCPSASIRTSSLKVPCRIHAAHAANTRPWNLVIPEVVISSSSSWSKSTQKGPPGLPPKFCNNSSLAPALQPSKCPWDSTPVSLSLYLFFFLVTFLFLRLSMMKKMKKSPCPPKKVKTSSSRPSWKSSSKAKKGDESYGKFLPFPFYPNFL